MPTPRPHLLHGSYARSNIMDLSESRQKDGSYVVLLPVSDTFIWPTQGGCNRWCLYNCITIQGHLMHTFWHYLITNQGNSDLHFAPVMFSQCIITMLHNLYRLNVRSITTFVKKENLLFFFFSFCLFRDLTLSCSSNLTCY